LPSNPIGWQPVIRLVAPIVARLAIRYALKKVKRSMSEDKVNLVAKGVGSWIGAMIDKNLTEERTA
jgi:hypothetical protein